MSVNLSIKNVPDEVVERLRERAKRHHRSLQGELLDVVARAADERPPMTARELYQRAKERFGSYEPTVSIADEVRQMRDERTAHLEQVMAEARSLEVTPSRRRSRGRR